MDWLIVVVAAMGSTFAASVGLLCVVRYILPGPPHYCNRYGRQACIYKYTR